MKLSPRLSPPIEIDITVSAASFTAEHEQIQKCKGQINIEK